MAGRLGLPQRRVVAWGRSVLASALVAVLAKRTDLELVQIEPTLPAALAAVHGKRVHAMLCDLASVPAACVLALLEAQPELMVLIVSPDAALGLALEGRRVRLRTIDDLVAVLLDGGAGGKTPPRSA